MDTFVRIENHGPLIRTTNYFDLPAARAGKVYVSVSAGAFRVLLPQTITSSLQHMRLATECVVSRGPWPEAGLDDAIEVLFDDRGDDPYAIHLGPESIDRMPPDSEASREWIVTVWTPPRSGSRPHKALERPGWYRRVPRVPWLESI